MHMSCNLFMATEQINANNKYMYACLSGLAHVHIQHMFNLQHIAFFFSNACMLCLERRIADDMLFNLGTAHYYKTIQLAENNLKRY